MTFDYVLSVLSGGISGAIVTWLLREWLSARIKGSIEHEYARQLENHKAEINTRVAALSYEFQRNQLRTQLFFDHQRTAFTEILTAIVEVKKAWLQASDPEGSEYASVPFDRYQALCDTYYRHQLFLDASCTASVDLVLSCMRDSLPHVDSSGEDYMPDAEVPLDRVTYLQPRLADQFRSRLGVDSGGRSEREIAVLGAMLLLNRFHFEDIGLPPTGVLKIPPREAPADTVARGSEHYQELATKLSEFSSYLRTGRHGVFHEGMTSAERYLGILRGRATTDVTT